MNGPIIHNRRPEALTKLMSCFMRNLSPQRSLFSMKNQVFLLVEKAANGAMIQTFSYHSLLNTSSTARMGREVIQLRVTRTK